MPYRAGEYAGRYEVVKLLGRGACGEVFQVRDPTTGSPYAMKAVPCDPEGQSAAAATRAREAALLEARLLQTLRHPYIVACEEVFHDAEQEVVRLVLEYMGGGDLQRQLAARREIGEAFPVQFAYRMLAEIGDALGFIHSAGVLHRDVKPANILLSAGGSEMKLGDFGIAKLVEAATLKANSMVGTPYYLSPELVAGQAYGAAADCWALGTCLYEVLTLRRAFEANNHLALMRLICEEHPPAMPAETPEDLVRVVYGLMAKDPGHRTLLSEAIHLGQAGVAAWAVADSGSMDCRTVGAGESSENVGHNATRPPTAHFGEQYSSDEDDGAWAHALGTAQAPECQTLWTTLDTEAVLKRASTSFLGDVGVDAAATLQVPLAQDAISAAPAPSLSAYVRQTIASTKPTPSLAPWGVAPPPLGAFASLPSPSAMRRAALNEVASTTVALDAAEVAAHPSAAARQTGRGFGTLARKFGAWAPAAPPLVEPQAQGFETFELSLDDGRV